MKTYLWVLGAMFTFGYMADKESELFSIPVQAALCAAFWPVLIGLHFNPSIQKDDLYPEDPY